MNAARWPRRHCHRLGCRRSVTGLLAAATATATAGILTLGTVTSAGTLLSDSFEDGDTAGWSSSGGDWKVVDDGSHVLAQRKSTNQLSRFVTGDSSWTDYSLTGRVKAGSFADGGLVGLVTRSSSSTASLRLTLRDSGVAELQEVSGSQVSVLGTAAVSPMTGWHTLRIETSGCTARGYVDGALIGTGTTGLAKGRVELITAGATASFDDIAVTTGADGDDVTVKRDESQEPVFQHHGPGTRSCLQTATDITHR